MAGFGGSVKLTGESEYRKALSQITQSLKVVSAEMKATSSSFANGEKSTKELSTSSKQLKDSLEKQKSALTTLKSQLASMQSEYKKTASNHQELVDKYEKEKSKLEEIEKTLGKSSQEYKDQQKIVTELGKEVADSSKKYDQQGRALNDVRIRTANAETQYNETARAVEELGNEARDSGEKALKASDGFTVWKGALSNLVSQGISKVVSGLKELGKATFSAGSNFESGMSQVSAISGATGDDLEKLTDKAKEMGAKTKYSATEATEAFKYMAMAGWKTEDMVDGIAGVMNLASASGEDLASVSDIVTDALTAMGYSAKDSGHFADVLASASSNANTSVGLMGSTFQYVAPLAGSMGYTIEDLATAIGIMANSGIKGQKAGTALRSVLSRLSAPPKECAEAMEKLGVSITNADGTMKPLNEVIGDMRKSFDGLSEAQKTQYAKSIAGQEAMSGLLALVNASPEDYDKLTQAIQNCDGASEKMANTMNDTVGGQITLLKSKIEGVMIKVFEKASGSIRDAIDKISTTLDGVNWDSVAETLGNFAKKAVDLFSYLIKNGDKVKAVINGIVAGFLAFKTVTFITSIVTGVQALFSAIEMGVPIMKALNIAMNANPIGIIITAIATLVGAFITLWNTNEDFRNFFIKIWENIKSVVGKVIDGIVGFFTETIPNAIDKMVTFFSELPSKIWQFLVNAFDKVKQFGSDMVSKAVEIGSNVIESITTFFSQLPEKIGYFIGFAIGKVVQWGVDLYEFATTKIPEFVDSVIEFISELPSKIWEWLVNAFNNVKQWGSDMVSKARQTASDFVDKVVSFLKDLPNKAYSHLKSVITKVTSWAKDMGKKGKEGAKELFDNVVNGLKQLPSKVLSIGEDIVKGIWNGINNMLGWIKGKVSGFCSGVLDGFKSALGIKSPSRVMRDKVGVFMAQGIAVGFEDEMANVTKEMQDAIPTSFDVGASINGVSAGSQGAFAQLDLIGAFKDALSQMKIELDDEVAGKFVEKTVARAIYT